MPGQYREWIFLSSGVDILVNNSGVYEFSPIEAVTEEQFHKIFNIWITGELVHAAGVLR